MTWYYWLPQGGITMFTRYHWQGSGWCRYHSLHGSAAPL